MAKYDFFDLKYEYSFSGDLVESLGVKVALARAALVADFTGDGVMDILQPAFELAVGDKRDYPPTNQLMLLAGVGNGRFKDESWRLPNDGTIKANIRATAIGDFNGDGVTDFVLATNYEDGRPIDDPKEMSVEQYAYLSGGGKFHRVDLGISTWGHGLSVGDWNGDGRDDIVVGGPADDDNGSHTVVAVQNDTGGFDPKYLYDTGYLSYVLADVDGNGQDELVQFHTRYVDGELQGSGLRVGFIDSNGNIATDQYVEQEAVRVEIGNGWNIDDIPFLIKLDNNGNEYVDEGIHQLKSADLNNDGREDVVAVRFGFSMHYVKGVLTQADAKAKLQLEFYTYSDDGMVPMDATISGWVNPKYTVYDFKIVDWNFDGHEDLFVYMPNNGKDCVHIFINDGAAHFSRIPSKLIPKGHADNAETAEAIDANGDGIMDLYYHVEDYVPKYVDLAKHTDAVYLGTKPFYTGPGFTNPALKGAAGFNEAYYLNENKDVARMVKSGDFKSGLEHYLKVGLAEGREAFAVGTHVYGSSKHDHIVLREGDETASGLGGNDTIEGGAGNDRLDGGKGDDTLTGGAGADEFVYSGGSDTITDFNAAEGDVLLGRWPV